MLAFPSTRVDTVVPLHHQDHDRMSTPLLLAIMSALAPQAVAGPAVPSELVGARLPSWSTAV